MKREFDVAAYIWPSYHDEPLWGYQNAADPRVMEQQIDTAADHGVNVFAYDWYWYDRAPFLESCLDDQCRSAGLAGVHLQAIFNGKRLGDTMGLANGSVQAGSTATGGA